MTQLLDDAVAAQMSPAIDLDRPGASEASWRAVLDGLPPIVFDDGPGGVEGRRVVVIAPHPDDESLGVGGTVATLADGGAVVHVVCLTDGEAAPCPTPDLANVRRHELFAAVRILAPLAEITMCALPDGRLEADAGRLSDRLATLIQPGDLVLATLDGDGHPDHDVAGAAAHAVAHVNGAELWWYGVWAWHWHDPRTSLLSTHGRRSMLTAEAIARRDAAIAQHRSQLEGAAAVVPADHVARCRRPYEVLVRA